MIEPGKFFGNWVHFFSNRMIKSRVYVGPVEVAVPKLAVILEQVLVLFDAFAVGALSASQWFDSCLPPLLLVPIKERENIKEHVTDINNGKNGIVKSTDRTPAMIKETRKLV